MSGKFMTIKRIALSTLTVLMIASQLTGCAGVTQQEAVDMVNRNDQIEIEIAVPNNTENAEIGVDVVYEWKELGYLDSHPEIREAFDGIMGTSILTSEGKEGKKGGTLYIDMNRQWTNNSTLRYAFNQLNFYKKLWNNESSLTALNNISKETFVDVETDTDALLSAINAYYNLFTTPEGYFNGSDTLTRAEYLTGVYKAHNPVSTLEANVELKNDEYNPFVNQMLPYSFTDMKNETNYTGIMTRGEAIYTLVKMYYANEVADGNTKHFVDTKDGGEISLSDALQNPDQGMPSDIYKALVIAENHGIIDGAESRWDEGITKKEALDMITRVYSEANLANSVEFATADSDNTADTGTIQENNGRLHINNVNGEIRYSPELKDAINSSLDKQGLSRDFGMNILTAYYNQVKDKDNSKIYSDIIESLTASLKADIKKAESQKQQNQNNNNNGSDTKVEVDDDGYVYENDNEYPSGNVNQDNGDYIPPDMPDITEGSDGGGSLADFFDNGGEGWESSGEFVTDTTMNP